MKKSHKPGKSPIRIIREFITEKLAKDKADGEKDPIQGIIGRGSGDGAPNARKHDEILYKRAFPTLRSG